ncbi:MAG: APC family permease [Acidobacteriota bacterium]
MSSEQQLKKALGASQYFTLAFGTIIGVAWVVVMGDWLNQAGPMGAILAFALGGLVMIMIGQCYAEISVMVPSPGGLLAWGYQNFGQKTGFVLGWLISMSCIAVTSFEAVSLGWIASALFPSIEGPVLYTAFGHPVRLGGLLLGLGMMALITLFNYRGAKSSGIFQDLLTYSKTGLALIFMIVGLLWGSAAHLEPLFRRSGTGSIWPGVLAVFLTAPFWFGGFDVIPQVIGEKSSGTNLKVVGRMIVLSLAIGAAFYILAILATSMTMPWEQLIGLNLPVATAFEKAFNASWLAKLILVAGGLGTITAWNGVFVSGSRLLFNMGKGHIITPALARVHPVFGSPSTAVLFVGALGACGVLVGRSAILPIVNATSACFAFSYLIVCLCVIKMRRTHPERPRPYRVPGGLVTATAAALAALFIVVLSLYQPYAGANGQIPLEWIILAIMIVLGAVFWALAGKVRNAISEKERRSLIIGLEEQAVGYD